MINSIQNVVVVSLFTLLLLTNFTFSTQTHLQGTVYDNFLDPLEAVTIKVEGKELTTDIDGNFSITTDATFPIKVTFMKKDYETKEVTFSKPKSKYEVVLEEL